jgi:SpoVK/Ycf46/Vps4 family AAA+-type ATPase
VRTREVLARFRTVRLPVWRALFSAEKWFAMLSSYLGLLEMFRRLPHTLFYGSKLRTVNSAFSAEESAIGMDAKHASMPNPVDRLKILINSSIPIVVMETVEELRAVGLVRSACAELNIAVFEWSIADGLVRSGSNAPAVPAAALQMRINATRHMADANAPESGKAAIYNTAEPVQALANVESMTLDAVFILKDFHRHLEEPVVVRRLRDVGQKFSSNRRTLVLTGPSISMPPELASLVEYLDLPLPDVQRLREIVEQTFKRLSKSCTVQLKADASDVEIIVANLRGLTEEEAERAISQALVARYALCPETAMDVLEAKRDLLRHSGMLEFIDVSENMATVGGLENLKRWLAQRHGAWEDSARAFGLEPPRGVIILGVQGCGKSMCARAVAGEWKLPLVKFDTAAVFDKFIGETEKRIQKVFKMAEGLAPCVLWIDELEKVFAGSGPDSASVDAGVSSRLLASFLGWMQERKAPVFVAATCNNVTALPPELIRKGRFDELFFVDLPNRSEGKQILAIQLSKRKRNPAEFDLDGIAAAAQGYSGAEIEAAVQTALYAAYSRRQGSRKHLNRTEPAGSGAGDDVANQDLLLALRQTVPLSTTRAEEIEELREWAKTRAVPASISDARAKGV